MESSGQLDIAMKYYEEAHDYLSLVRVYCFRDDIQKVHSWLFIYSLPHAYISPFTHYFLRFWSFL